MASQAWRLGASTSGYLRKRAKRALEIVRLPRATAVLSVWCLASLWCRRVQGLVSNLWILLGEPGSLRMPATAARPARLAPMVDDDGP